MKLTSVTIENMNKIDLRTYDLNQFNYFYGENGQGKSTVLQAIQLALTGQMTDLSKPAEYIYSHAKTKGKDMSVMVTLDNDGEEIIVKRTWYCKSASSKLSTSYKIACRVEISPEGYDINDVVENLKLPIFNFNKFSHMTANESKDWFIDLAMKLGLNEKTDLNLKNELFSALPKDVSKNEISDILYLTKNIGKCDIESVRTLNQELKSALSYMKAELTRVQSTIRSLLLENNEAIEESEIEYLEEQLSKYINNLKQLESEINAYTNGDTDTILSLESTSDKDRKNLIDIDNDFSDLISKLISAKINYKMSSLIDSLTQEQLKLERCIEVLKIWVELTGVNRIQNRLMNSIMNYDLAEHINKYLQVLFPEKDVKVFMNMGEKSNSFSYGIMRNSKYIPFEMMSSGERCKFTFALMLSIVDILNSPIKLVIIDDFLDHLDSKNAILMQNCLNDSENILKDFQIIFAGVSKPEIKAENKYLNLIEVRS